MLLIISNQSLERIIAMADSAWKTGIEALISTISTGAAGDDATKAAVADLTTKMADADARLATLESFETEAQAVISDIVTKLQASDITGALAAAQAAQTSLGAGATGGDASNAGAGNGSSN